MKRLNITIDPETYENARVAAFLTHSNISSIIRSALKDWFEKINLRSRKKLVLDKQDIDSLKEVLKEDQFLSLAEVKKELSL